MSSGVTVVAEGESFNHFFIEHARRVAAAVALITGDRELAEDATQEAMARAYARWDRVSKLDRPDLWVTHIAGNLAIDAWRKRRHEVSATDGLAGEPQDELRTLCVRWAMAELSPQDRLLLILRHYEGLSIEEISRSVGRTPHTITRYLKRARHRLRSLLSEGDG